MQSTSTILPPAKSDETTSKVATEAKQESPIPNIYKETADLENYPTPRTYPPDTTITIDDLHGNTMKLLWVLIYEGGATVSPNDFNAIWKIYNEMGEGITSKDIEAFNKILARIKITPNFKLRLMGDNFADRGVNDYLTIKLLERMRAGGAKTEIIYSNHLIQS